MGRKATRQRTKQLQDDRLQRQRAQSRIRGRRWWSRLSDEQREIRRERQRKAYRQRQQWMFRTQSEPETHRIEIDEIDERQRLVSMLDIHREKHMENLLLHRHNHVQEIPAEPQCIESIEAERDAESIDNSLNGQCDIDHSAELEHGIVQNNVQQGRIRLRDIRRLARHRNNVQQGRIRLHDIRQLARQFSAQPISNCDRQVPEDRNDFQTSCVPQISQRSGCNILQGRTRLTQLRRQARLNQPLHT